MSACVASSPSTSWRMRVQQQARGDIGVGRVLLDQRARGQDRRTCALRPSARRRTGSLSVSARIGSGSTSAPRPAQADSISACQARRGRAARAAPPSMHVQRRRFGGLRRRALLARAPARGARGTARRRARPRARRRASGRARPGPGRPRCGTCRRPACADQRRDDGVGEVGDQLAHARRSRALGAVHGEERLGHRDRDLGRLEADHGAVAADDLVLREPRIGAACTGLPGSPTIRSRGGTEEGVEG